MKSEIKQKNSVRLIKAKLMINTVIRFPQRVLAINRIINKKTYYPEMKRKSKLKMWKENFLWLLKEKELNSFYTSYGLDVENFRNPSDYLPNYEFTYNRTLGNQRLKYSHTGNYNYLVLLRDKYVFASYMSSSLGEKVVPKTLGVIVGKEVFDYEKHSWSGLENYFSENKEVVFKYVDGECANGVALVKIHDGKVLTSEGAVSWQDYMDTWSERNILIQEVVKQHEKIAYINSGCVNTIRIVTIKGKSGAVGIFAAFLRVGSDATSFVDNRAKGGLGVGIQLNTGQLMKYGYVHDAFGIKEDEHPVSHVKFEGYQLPYWDETKELVKNAHKQFYELESIGWDVVITPDGPILLEGNDDWEISGPQDTAGGLKKKWYELRNS